MTAEKSRPISIARPQHINKDENKKSKKSNQKRKTKRGCCCCCIIWQCISFVRFQKRKD
jgi:hypothetical protein